MNLSPYRSSDEAHEVDLIIESIKNVSGYLMIAVYNNENDFLSDRIYSRERVKVLGKSSQSIKLNLPSGNYAIAVYHDINEDSKLNKSIIGFPAEPYGFSGDDYSRFGPPNWSDAVLRIEKDERIRISID